MADHPTPNDMPGAAPSETDAKPGEPTEAQSAKADEGTTSDLTPDERAELERLRAQRRDEKLWETRSKANAKKLKDVAQLLGIETSEFNPSEFDPKSELGKLRSDFEQERIARVRSEVARTEGVDLEDISGTTEEEMRESAKRFKAKIDARVEAALKGRAPAAAPAKEVTANGKVDGPKQIKSRDDLKNMTPAERVEAFKNGQLDAMVAGKD